MKNLILTTIVAGIALTTARAAIPEQKDRGSQLAMTWPWSHGLKEEVAHLNRMRGHVRWQLRNYKANKEIRNDFARVSRDIDQINSQFQSASPDRRKLSNEVERAHAALHRIETALKVKSRDYYPWK